MKYKNNYNRLDITIDTEFDGKQLADFFDTYRQSRKNRYLLLQNKNIEINHKPARNESEILKNGDILSIKCESGDLGFEPALNECSVVYEDDFVYVAHKDAGIIIHGDLHDNECLASQAAAYQMNHGINVPVRYIHRLDKDTSGLVLFVKFPFFQPWFDAMLEEKKIQRHYLAICTGRAKVKQAFTFQQPIGKDRHVNGKFRVSETGKPALTKACCLSHRGEYLLMECLLETGRTHQIRVHLSASNHPIVNDPLYGLPSDTFRYMGLWADRIVFENPLTHEICTAKDVFNPDFHYFDKALQHQ